MKKPILMSLGMALTCCVALAGCGLAEVGAAAATQGATAAEQAKEAKKLEAQVQQRVEDANRVAAEQREAALRASDAQ